MNPEGITILLFIVSCEVPNERNTIKTKSTLKTAYDIGASVTGSIIKSTHGKAVHLGEYKMHPHKTKVRNQLERTYLHMQNISSQISGCFYYLYYTHKSQVRNHKRETLF